MLPAEMQLWIFSFLNGNDLQVTSLVCKYWKVLSGDPSLWREIHLSNPRNMSNVAAALVGKTQLRKFSVEFSELSEYR